MRILLILLLILLVPTYAQSLTFKGDGSVVQSDGKVLKKSNATRYQEALEAYYKGEEVKNWPVVVNSLKGTPRKHKGYFGEKMLNEGAPLFSIEKVRGSGDKLMENIAKNNGFASSDGLNLAIVVNSNKKFQTENNILPESMQSMEIIYDGMIEKGGLDVSSVTSRVMDETLSSVRDSVRSEMDRDSDERKAREDDGGPAGRY